MKVILPKFLISFIYLAIALPIVAMPKATTSIEQDRQPAVISAQQSISNNQTVLPEIVGANWKATNKSSTARTSAYKSPLVNDVSLEYGLKNISTRIYSNGKDRLLVEAFEMFFPSGAYGFFTHLRSLGNAGCCQFYRGNYVFNVRSKLPTKTVTTQFTQEFLQALAIEKNAPPPLVSHLPGPNIVPASENYFSGPKALGQSRYFGSLATVVSFDGGTEATSATYQFGAQVIELIIFEFHTPQLATDGNTKIETYLNTLPEDKKSISFSSRVGNYVVLTSGAKDKQLAENLIGQIKYTAKVYWEGNKFTSIPIEFRPPDPAAIEEANQTAQVLLRAFYWIGAMLVLAAVMGILVGSSFFYWRKYQRKKRGEDLLFSDAGGTIRLNLETAPLKITEGK